MLIFSKFQSGLRKSSFLQFLLQAMATTRVDCRGTKNNTNIHSMKSFWSIFSRIRTEYGKIHWISLYSVPMRENRNQKNSKYEHLSRSDYLSAIIVYDNRISQVIVLHFLELKKCIADLDNGSFTFIKSNFPTLTLESLALTRVLATYFSIKSINISNNLMPLVKHPSVNTQVSTKNPSQFE